MPHISHSRFDLASFSAMFPLRELRERAHEHAFLMPSGPIITSPFHLAVAEQLRREALGGAVPEGARPVDVFVFGAGEPPGPYLTKIGGVPFRSRRKSWPRKSDGRPLGFVGQISFVDSGDVVSGLPGDVLLIFVDPEDLLSRSEYVFEWVRLDEREPMSKSEIPDVHYTWKPGRMARRRGAQPEMRRFEPFVCHGVIHRTFDLPGHEALFDTYAHPYRLSVLEGTKIGGVPRCVQGPLESMGGRFIAALASIQPAPEVAYPWSNQAAPIPLMSRHKIQTWEFGDSGSLYMFQREDGGVRLDAQSY